MTRYYYISSDNHYNSEKAVFYAINECIAYFQNSSEVNLLVPNGRYNEFRLQGVNVITPRSKSNFLLQEGRDITIIASGVALTTIEKYDFKVQNIAVIIDDFESHKNWLTSREAIDIRTGLVAQPEEEMAPLVAKAIEWLDGTSFPLEGMLHPLDRGRLQDTANALATVGIDVNEVAISVYCRKHGWPMAVIEDVISTFRKAINKPYTDTPQMLSAAELFDKWKAEPTDFPKLSYLKSIELSNLWDCSKLSWQNIDPEVNILIGINGSGKTTLLESIYSKANGLPINKVVGEVKTAPQPRRLYPMTYLRTFDTPANDKRKNESKLMQELNNIVYQTGKGKSFFGYRVKQMDVEDAEAEGIKDNIKQFFSIVDELFSESGKRIEITKDSQDSKLVFRNTKTEQIIPLEALSSGEKQMLLILLQILLQEKTPHIALMDEPEVSLHIRWQRALIDTIRKINPNCQLVIATHSPSILSKGWGDKVTYMEDIVKMEERNG